MIAKLTLCLSSGYFVGETHTDAFTGTSLFSTKIAETPIIMTRTANKIASSKIILISCHEKKTLVTKIKTVHQ